MTRTRRTRPELTESWDDIGDSYEDDRPIYDEEDERDELGEEYRLRDRANDSRVFGNSSRETPRRRNLRSSPELIMPSSPDGGAQKRASTPHMRMNQRSLTSDAGEIRKQQRSKTPRMRLSDRSITGDAGRLRSSHLKEHEEMEEEKVAGQTGRIIWTRAVQPFLIYGLDIVALVMNNLKPLIAYGMVVYLILAVLVFGAGFLNNSIKNALSPICRLPFTGHLTFCPSPSRPELEGIAEFDKLVQAQDAFQDVLASTEVGSNLPVDMKRSESSIRDLKHVVQYSSLPSRNELVFEFVGFIDTARQASQDLSRFNSRIGRAVDHILSTNRWTLSVIDGVTTAEASKGAISRWVTRNLNIFAPFQPVSLSRDILLDQYLRHTSAVEEQILSLISEALALRDILDNLDGRLDLIASIVTRDGIKLATNKDELFAALWTKLGGNRSTVSKLNQQIGLLNSVGQYRRQAWGHVTATLLKLQEIRHSLEDLRERVALPETIGTTKVPLEVHIESINLGIERLETQRDATRQLEKDNYARIVAKGDAAGDRAGRMIESPGKEL